MILGMDCTLNVAHRHLFFHKYLADSVTLPFPWNSKFELQEMSRVAFVFQPSCFGRSDHVHLRTTGNGSRKWTVGGRRCPGSNQTGDAQQKPSPMLYHLEFHQQNQIQKTNNIWKFFLQALVNMGEILKAAGCGYDNGKETPINLTGSF